MCIRDSSKPVLPNRTHLDYIPTQFICEFFKTVCGFHGLVFNSSFGNGKNIVLFDQNLVEDGFVAQRFEMQSAPN